ncbi:MAG: CAP domain-containing protein [Thermoanaerobaculia bacterium]
MKRLALLLLIIVALPAAATEITTESIVAEMNEYRRAEGLAPLFVDRRLTAAAKERMDDMEQSGHWRHEPSGGGSPFAAMSRNGFVFSMAGENLATGFETAEILVESWMLSPGHRINVMSPQFTSVGVATIDGHVARRADGKSVIAVFAREMVQPVRKKK